MIWVAGVIVYLKRHFGRNQVSSDPESDRERNFSNSQLRSDEISNEMADSSLLKSGSIPAKAIESSTSSSWRTKTPTDVSDEAIHASETNESHMGTANTISMDVFRDMLNESLEGVYQQLAIIKQSNEEQHKQTKKRFEQIKETGKTQHRETRRRFEKLEKKTNSGDSNYFNHS